MNLRNRCASSLVLLLVAAAGAQTVDPGLYSGMAWRNIGPFRGGRVAAVSGVIGEPGTFYMGMPLGGVWKTTSAGTTWYPIMDSVKEASSVGAIEVAPSDPNVIYVGMGDLVTGGGINEGNGVYKSTDAGKTWQHLGLDETKQIPSILVDPHDPNLVMIAAQGNLHKRSEERGLYRSTDGGKTWTKTLYVDDETGIQKIAWAYDNPKVMLATTVRHYIAPGGGGRGGGFGGGPAAPGQGGSGTKLFKSTDEGLTWKEVKSESLPSLSGRTCVAIACNTNSQRMFLVQNSGLYRSDDGGDTWRQMDKEDQRVRNGQGGYNCGVYVDPQNPDLVYVINTCSYVSRDGGKTFSGFKGAPGGDDPQQVWIDPTNGKRLFFGMDQGATISLDGGLNWSSWYNQPTGQFYHISCDNQFPYWVYGTEQDSGSIGTASRGNYGAVTPMDWSPHPGYEFGSIVADPLNPKITYAGGQGGGIVKVTDPSGQWINVSPNADSSLGLRKVGNQPLVWSQTNPKELFTGFQYLMSTTDGGMHWKKLSPDLGAAKGQAPAARPGAPGGGGSTANGWMDDDEADGEAQFGGGAVIESISPSSVDGNLIWVGTNTGLIKLTRDHGKTWEDVSINGLPARGDVSAIDASHHDPGTAYAAIDFHSSADFTPWFYRTRDYGKTWTKIVAGMRADQPSGSFARVIRADTKARGLVFAGTESSVYVSFDDGDHWQSLMLNLPNTSYRDMVIKDNDVVVGTYGRAFWVLDDISTLRDLASKYASFTTGGRTLAGPFEATAPTLFTRGGAIRVRRNVNQDTPFPPEVPHALNPPISAIDYYLPSQASLVQIEISDSAGQILRHFTSTPAPATNEPPPPIPDFWVEQPQPLETSKGMHRVNWNLRCDNPPSLYHSYEINANPGQTPASPEGPLLAPGTYVVKLTVDGKASTQTLVVRNDPRSNATAQDLRAQNQLQSKLYNFAKEAWQGYRQVADMRAAVAQIIQSNPAPEVSRAAGDFDSTLATVGGSTGGGRRFGGGFGGGGGASTPTFSAAMGNLVRQLGQLDASDLAPSEALAKACNDACAEYAKALARWRDVNAKELAAFNAVLTKFSLKPIAAALAGTGAEGTHR